jgi:hypothetical protein
MNQIWCTDIPPALRFSAWSALYTLLVQVYPRFQRFLFAPLEAAGFSLRIFQHTWGRIQDDYKNGPADSRLVRMYGLRDAVLQGTIVPDGSAALPSLPVEKKLVEDQTVFDR